MSQYECVACSKMTNRRGYCEPCQALSVEIRAAHDKKKQRECLVRSISRRLPLADWQDFLPSNEGRF